MQSIIVLGIVGLLAQLVDGALGMAYGATSTSLLLLTGLSPAVASASVHLSEVGTTAASGVAHWRLGNVDRRLVLLLGLPGAVGGLVGATVLSSLSTAAARPVMGTVLAAIGVHLLVRRRRARRVTGRVPARMLAPLGVVAGFVDATGGGGWGPLSTPALLVTGRVEPRRVIGSVDTAEFLVTTATSLGFLVALGDQAFHTPAVLALLAGGLVAAPIAAWLVRVLPAEVLGPSVGGLLLVTNVGTVAAALGASQVVGRLVVAAAAAGWVVVVLHTVAMLRARRLVAEAGVPDDPVAAATDDVASPAGRA